MVRSVGEHGGNTWKGRKISSPCEPEGDRENVSWDQVGRANACFATTGGKTSLICVIFLALIRLPLLTLFF